MCECLTFGARPSEVAEVDSSVEDRRDDGASDIRLIEDVRLTPVAEDMAEWVDDLEIPLERGMTVDEPDEEVACDADLKGLERSSSGRLMAGISLRALSFEMSLAVSDLGRPRPSPELSLSEVSVTDMSRRCDGLLGASHGEGGTNNEVLDEPDTRRVDGVRYPRLDGIAL